MTADGQTGSKGQRPGPVQTTINNLITLCCYNPAHADEAREQGTSCQLFLLTQIGYLTEMFLPS